MRGIPSRTRGTDPGHLRQTIGAAKAHELREQQRRRRTFARWRGAAAAAVVPPVLTAVLTRVPHGMNLTSRVLLFLVAVVAIARLGGMLSALAAAIWASLLLNYYFIFPLHSASIADANDAIALVVFVIVALTVASVVDLAAKQSRRAARANAEAETLNVLSVSVLRGDGALSALLDQLRDTFGAASVSLLQLSGEGSRSIGSDSGNGAFPHIADDTALLSATSAAHSSTHPAAHSSSGPADHLTLTPARPLAPLTDPAPPTQAAPAYAADPLPPADSDSAPLTVDSVSVSPWIVIAASGPDPAESPDQADTVVAVGSGGQLALRGRVLSPADQHVLAAFTAQATAALERRALAQAAAHTANLEAADKMRTAVLTAVSHDLRAPLSAARAAVNTLADPELEVGAQDRVELLDIADDSLARLTRLVEDLLDMSRLQAGALKPRLEPFAAEEIVPPALDSLSDATERVRFDQPAPDVPAMLADGPLLERVVANLVANAIRHTDSPVRITAVSRHGLVELRVTDHGPGIPDSARDLLFRPFQRLGDRDNSTGVGLGLALARGLTESMGGTLVPEHTPGGGLTMVVSLPAAPEAVPDPAATSAEP
ncbi:MAG TPA: ATP-binding protein [Actinocrinis sp.]|nr:ATP-binding protein [Actinocrinis sp.]